MPRGGVSPQLERGLPDVKGCTERPRAVPVSHVTNPRDFPEFPGCSQGLSSPHACRAGAGPTGWLWSQALGQGPAKPPPAPAAWRRQKPQRTRELGLFRLSLGVFGPLKRRHSTCCTPCWGSPPPRRDPARGRLSGQRWATAQARLLSRASVAAPPACAPAPRWPLGVGGLCPRTAVLLPGRAQRGLRFQAQVPVRGKPSSVHPATGSSPETAKLPLWQNATESLKPTKSSRSRPADAAAQRPGREAGGAPGTQDPVPEPTGSPVS